MPALFEYTEVSWEQLATAATAAAGLPDLCGRQAAVVQARNAAVQLACVEGLGTAAIGDLPQLSTRRVRSAREEPADPHLVRAVKLQLALRKLKPPGSNGI